MGSSDKQITINITTGTFMRAILILLLLSLLYFIRDIVVLVLFSIVLASGIEPWALWFQKRKLPRILGVVLIYLISISFLAFVFYLVVPPIFSEVSKLSSSIPEYLDSAVQFKTIQNIFPELPESFSSVLLGFADSIKAFLGNLTSGFLQTATSLFGGAFSLLMILVVSFYLSVQEKGIEHFLRVVSPINKEDYVVDLWLRTRNKIGAWLKGQVLLGVLVGMLVYLGLTILGVEYALTLALVAALFELIPVFGATLAAIPAVAVALLASPTLALYVLILYIIIQQFENHLIYPLVVRKIVGVPPILVILSLVVGAKLLGFFGVLLSIPAVVLLMEIFEDMGKQKQLLKQAK